MINKLLTIKSKSFPNIIHIIDEIMLNEQDFGRYLAEIIHNEFSGSKLIMNVDSINLFNLNLLAILAFIACDISTVPYDASRAKYKDMLSRICNYYSININDVLFVSKYTSIIENKINDSQEIGY